MFSPCKASGHMYTGGSALLPFVFRHRTILEDHEKTQTQTSRLNLDSEEGVACYRHVGSTCRVFSLMTTSHKGFLRITGHQHRCFSVYLDRNTAFDSTSEMPVEGTLNDDGNMHGAHSVDPLFKQSQLHFRSETKTSKIFQPEQQTETCWNLLVEWFRINHVDGGSVIAENFDLGIVHEQSRWAVVLKTPCELCSGVQNHHIFRSRFLVKGTKKSLSALPFLWTFVTFRPFPISCSVSVQKVCVYLFCGKNRQPCLGAFVSFCSSKSSISVQNDLWLAFQKQDEPNSIDL